MIYATHADIIAAYGEDALWVADRDDDALVDEGVTAAALEGASAEIDAYLAARYPLPLAEAPLVLRRPCVDIAVYRLSGDGGALTDEKRRRYEDAIDFLKMLASGKSRLNLPDDGEGGGGDEFDSPQPIVADGPPRLWSRDQTRGL